MVATAGSDELQVTLLVRFCIELSLKVPVAVNCWVIPVPSVGDSGVTAMDVKVGPIPATVIVPDVPVIVAVTISVAVIVCAPAVFNVAEKVPTPFVSVELAGSVAAASLLVKCTVPVYPVAVAFDAFNAVTVILN